jgi:DNA topoisomerase-2
MNKMQVSQFLNTGFKSFSRYDCVINIPSMVDGFKVSQRKVMHTMLARNKSMKVEQFANDASAVTHYKHGSSNLEGVIVGLAQDYPGSNNVNFLTPDGQFGNMLNSAAAAGRYIFVEPNPNFRKWFRKDDDIILEYEMEDVDTVEPTFFIPIVPTLLFNGSSGIGTGYACKILSYKPEDVVENVRLALLGKKLKPMTPWYRGYTGDVQKIENQTTYTGKFERVNTTTIKVTALPIGYDLDSYKEDLAKMIERDEIKDYDDNSTDTQWEFLITAPRAFLMQDDATLINKLKLVSRESENITVWTEDKKIKCFNNPEELIQHFVDWRVGVFEERRLKLIELLSVDLDWANEKIRFIQFFLKNTKWFSETKKNEIIARLEKEKFVNITELLNIRVYNLQYEEIEKLKAEIQTIEAKIIKLNGTTAKDMYLDDLKEVK